MPLRSAPSYTNAGTCSGGNVVDFVNGVGTANLTLFDAQSITLSATDVPTSVAGLTTLSVAPGVLQNLAVAPQTSNPVAGTPFATDLTAFDEYGNVDTNYTGSECIAFSGPTNSPNATAPIYPVGVGCTAGSPVTFAAGYAVSANAPNITLFDSVGGVLDAQDVPTGASGFAGLTVSPGGPRPSTWARHRPKWSDRPSRSASQRSIRTETSIRTTPVASASPSAVLLLHLMGRIRTTDLAVRAPLAPQSRSSVAWRLAPTSLRSTFTTPNPQLSWRPTPRAGRPVR